MNYSEKDALNLRKILAEINFMEKELHGVNFDSFMKNELLQKGIAMTLVNIGELANRLSDGFKSTYKEIPIKKIIGMRNITAHTYDFLDFKIVWNTVQDYVPELKLKIESLIV